MRIKRARSCHAAALVAALAFFAHAPAARGAMSTQVGIGSVLYGKLKTRGEVSVKAQPFTLGFNYFLSGPAAGSQYRVGLLATFAGVSYQSSGEAKSGLYTLAGFTAAYVMEYSKEITFTFGGGFYPYNSLAVVSKTDSVINDTEVTYSTLSIMKGALAIEPQAAATYELMAFRKQQKLRMGAELKYLHHRITSKRDQVVISRPELGGPRESESAVDFTLSLLTLGLLIEVVF